MRPIRVKLTSVNHRLSRLMLVVGTMTVAVLVMPPAANASCAGSPAESPHAFVGTVINTSEENRIATVITDDGRRVTVLGTEDTSWLSESFSSIDRRYALGARYAFHPTNATTPYRDNTCTATHNLAGPDLQPLEPSKEFLPGWLPVDEQAGPIGYALFFGPVLAGAVGLAFLARWVRRRPVKTG
jgi:hypothetical protein